jgi:hypothetical protein
MTAAFTSSRRARLPGHATVEDVPFDQVEIAVEELFLDGEQSAPAGEPE